MKILLLRGFRFKNKLIAFTSSSLMLLRFPSKKSPVFNLKEINVIFTSAVIVLRINVTQNSFFPVTQKALSSL